MARHFLVMELRRWALWRITTTFSFARHSRTT